jgi:ElaB/YqjD/DUF883 family membrane-anchored ribosome-binding protein
MENQSTTDSWNAVQDATASASNVADTVRNASSDAATVMKSAVAKAADQAQQAGGKAVDATKAYAKNAVDAAGRKVSDIKTQLESAKASATVYIKDDPIRAVQMAAIGGALLSAALVMFSRRDR